VDRRTWSGDLEHDEHAPSPAVVDVALHVDGTRWRQLWLDTVSLPPRN
jgi:pyrimidine-specific ribonucleoside hydrolase